ncbi:hypothetical protein SAMN04489740_0731 [Arthrobacter alpinus]|uniref:Uncharacterized protein n=1 Tax=Arthrobacter alpinus TaxID=656366 RepID=A0A1H5GEC9_9MICC|nr:hypothetical protein SAMN04489740_0731 [Arthrobacter alpinus]
MRLRHGQHLWADSVGNAASCVAKRTIDPATPLSWADGGRPARPGLHQ